MIRLSSIRQRVLTRPVGVFCIAFGAALLGLNVAGLVIPLRNPEIYQEPRSYAIGDTNGIITAEELWRRVERREGEPVREYVKRATEAVSDGIAFISDNSDATVRKYNRRIPIRENYLLWASRHVLFLKAWATGKVTWENRAQIYIYVFSNHCRAIERGEGVCGQQAVVLMGVLQERGIPARFVGFSGHGLVTAEVDPGVWWVLDPSFRTVLPHDLAMLRENPNVARAAYEANGMDAEWLELCTGYFVEPPPRPYLRDSIRETHGTARYYFEFASYYLIWIFPAGLIGAGFGCVRSAGRRPASARVLEAGRVHAASSH